MRPYGNTGWLIGIVVGFGLSMTFGPQNGWHNWIWSGTADLGCGWLLGSLWEIGARLSDPQ